ncbi:MAG: FeoA family protein [Sulfurospirillaceae bacterium]|nr:FeoA family protein [Sulfurospirillaceae bacterium]MDD2827115.1 FeoA family protein [Sulfurospirillaceae bacterium]
MNLSQISKNTKVMIKTITAQSLLKKRLYSLGLGSGKEVEITEISLQKNTIKIALGFSSIALRMEEAKMIEVEAIV